MNHTSHVSDKLLDIYLWTLGLITFFFLFTNGLPLLDLGITKVAFNQKKNAVGIVRLFLIIFSGSLLLIYLYRKKHFIHLSSIRVSRQLLGMPPRYMSGILFILYSALSITANFMRYAAFETRAYDLGNYSQAIWNTLQGDFLWQSIRGGITLLEDHVSPGLVLLTPFYSLWPDPRMLLVLQALASASCVFLISRMALQNLEDHRLANLFALAFFFYRPVRNFLREDFHPEVLIEPLIFVAFFCLEKKRMFWFFLCLLLILSAKENMAGIVFIFGVYAFGIKNRRVLGLIIMAGAVAIFFTSVLWLVPMLSGKPYFYSSLYQGEGFNLFSVIVRIFNTDSLSYCVKLFGPLLFLSLFHPPTLLLTSPILFQNLISNSDVFRSFGYHYAAGINPAIFISAIFGFQMITQKIPFLFKHRLLIGLAMLFSVVLQSGPSEYYFLRQSMKQNTPHKMMISRELAKIPSSQSVLTHNSLMPQLSNRKDIYQFDYNPSPSKDELAHKWGVDLVIFDRQFWEPLTAPPDVVLRALESGGYEIYFEDDGFYMLRRQP